MRLVGVLSLFLLAGCGSPGYSDPSGAPPGNPTRHDLASNSGLEIPAGEVFWNSFTVEGGFPVAYEIQFPDGSTADVGFILQSDLAEYQQGQQVQAWAYQSNTLGTSQQVHLGPGAYAFIVRCNNDFLDCDGAYNLWATY